MLPPSTRISTTTTTTSTTISESLTNFSAYVSGARPWPTLTSSLSRPNSVNDALARLQTNSKHFLINFVLIISLTTILFALVANPFGTIIYVALVAAWLLGYVFREGALDVNGREVSDRTVFFGLMILTLLVILWVGMVNTFSVGLTVGVIICAGIGICRDTDGLFLDEDDAVSNGLIASSSRPKGSYV